MFLLVNCFLVFECLQFFVHDHVQRTKEIENKNRNKVTGEFRRKCRFINFSYSIPTNIFNTIPLIVYIHHFERIQNPSMSSATWRVFSLVKLRAQPPYWFRFLGPFPNLDLD